jgi:hypothetical protein
MKLYTEEQLIKAIHIARVKITENDIYPVKVILSQLKSIQLPSDESIDKNKPLYANNMYEIGLMYGFKDGAKWVTELIKQQDEIN